MQNQQMQQKNPICCHLSLVDAFVYQKPPIRERRHFQILSSCLFGPPFFVGSTNRNPQTTGGCRGDEQRELQVSGGTVD